MHWTDSPAKPYLGSHNKGQAMSQPAAARAFRALHESPKGFIMPNAWDAGSAILLAHEGFPAIGTTSAGIAFALGKQDYRVDDPRSGVTANNVRPHGRDRGVRRAGERRFEAGFGDAPETVAQTIAMAVEAVRRRQHRRQDPA
jgi:hypothetical protein